MIRAKQNNAKNKLRNFALLAQETCGQGQGTGGQAYETHLFRTCSANVARAHSAFLPGTLDSFVVLIVQPDGARACAPSVSVDAVHVPLLLSFCYPSRFCDNPPCPLPCRSDSFRSKNIHRSRADHDLSLYGSRSSTKVVPILRGNIVKRTYGRHKNPVYFCIFTITGDHS